MLHVLSFAVVSDVIRWWFVTSTVFAAIGRLAFDTACFVSLTGPPVLGGTEKYFSLGPEPAVGGSDVSGV
jgi:hypothetical protein